MTTEETFLESWKKLEHTTTQAFPQWEGNKVDEFLAKMQVEGIDFATLKSLRNVRNALAHNPIQENGKPIVMLNCDMLKFIDNVIKIVRTLPDVGSIMIPFAKVYSCSMETKLDSVIAKMVKCSYSYVPVLDNTNRVVGVFGEHSQPLGRRIFLPSTEMTIDDIAPYVKIEDSRRTDIFAFVKKSDRISRLRRMCVEARQKNKRLEMFFVTENGCAEDPLLGIVTIWDFVGMTDRESADVAKTRSQKQCYTLAVNSTTCRR